MPSHSLTLRFCDTHGNPLCFQALEITVNHQKIALYLNKEGYSDPLVLSPTDWEGTVVIDHCETLDLQTGYPTHKQMIALPLYRKAGLLLLTVIPAPIVIHLQKEPLLNAEQIDYFKQNGNNALLFIHGYHIDFGQYGCYPDTFEFTNPISIVEPHFKDAYEKNIHTQIEFKKTHYTRTICCDLTHPDEISAAFPELMLPYKQHFSRYRAGENPEGIGAENAVFNGTGACQWFVHMEYNFNRAAGLPIHQYGGYTRILGVHWPGKVGLANFQQAERNCDDFSDPFRRLLQQLIEHNIQINIVAHSLGCRIVLQALKKLAEKNKEDCIEQVILWQAALPSHALTDHPAFYNAYKSAKSMTILHSLKDTILRTFYSSSHLNTFSIIDALGYKGAKQDPLFITLQKSKRVLSVDHTPYLHGHSFMKVPSASLMQNVYQEYIIGGNFGIKSFGQYPLV